MVRSQVSLPRPYRVACEAALGKELAIKAAEGYSLLRSERPTPEDARLRRHLHGHILPGLAIYRALREGGLDEKAALEAIEKVFGILAAGMRGKFLWLGKLPFFYGMLRIFMPAAMRAYPASGWNTTWLEASGERMRFDIDRCYYCDSLRERGAPELAASYCRIDDLIYDGLSAAYAWKRTTTLARGDAKCDFRFERRPRG
ncbi:MAG: L-2-amino-thiazoline-4-carboxylic acid hydrolase [Spirochaetaceae bacterium]|nr:L-2-amino-thiazoline-4-carboxylic acid hydrolase [Spirochaetaceae bacterium]